ncbi:hypothetical protein ES319_A01G150600v1 [Gossypium barbadense]|uniref:Glycosyltransferase N-terminal domain-containing protein n=1 Tax=Gossypium barbadense TaxID=3634 RepID=A0A5J5X0J5_GOSBA|nr:hypothetical protein ES319_A01G150600v1 [Gossypium barbadense]
MEHKQFKGHVILLPYPSQGHINPLLQFAKRLASKGVKSTLATTHYTVNSICAAHIGVEPVSDGFDEGGFSQAGNVDFYLKSFKEEGSRSLSQLIQKFKDSSTLLPVWCMTRFCHGLLMWQSSKGFMELLSLPTLPLCVASFLASIMAGLLCR